MLKVSETLAQRYQEHVERYGDSGAFSVQIFIEEGILDERIACMGLVCQYCAAEVPARPTPDDVTVWEHWSGGPAREPCRATVIRQAWAVEAGHV